jgi:hypothetical protein
MNDAADSPGSRPRSSHWVPALATTALLTAIVAFEVPVCPCAVLLGIPCPGCGLGRAGLELLHGDVVSAVTLHPLSPIALPAVPLAVAWNAGLSSRYAPRVRRIVAAAALLLVGALLGVWVARFTGAFGGPIPVRSPLRAQPSLTR